MPHQEGNLSRATPGRKPVSAADPQWDGPSSGLCRVKNLGHILEKVSGRLGHLEIYLRKISCFCLLLSQKYFDYPRGPGLVVSQYRPFWALLPAWYQPPTACLPAKFQPQWVLALPHGPCSPSSACFNLIFPLPVASLSPIPLLPPPSFTLDPFGVVPTCRLAHPPRNPNIASVTPAMTSFLPLPPLCSANYAPIMSSPRLGSLMDNLLWPCSSALQSRRSVTMYLMLA